jgi:gamma-glutamyl:cysteine ligase YbdK (ATP-grasp superfamily)
VSFADRELEEDDARALSEQVHDQIPLMLAIGANSPVWDRRMTRFARNRVLKGSAAYFAPLRRGEVSTKDLQEMRYAPGRKTKPPTLELRILDSNIPEFVIASMVVLKAVALRWAA